jgi:glycosyltransferase involved in cell wall biosynthesis
MPPAPPTIAVDLRALVPEPTGIGVYNRSLLLELAARGGMRYVGMAHKRPRHAEELEAAGVPIEAEPAPLGVLWQQVRLPRRLRRGDIDLLWSPLMTLPASCPVPAVVTVHDLTALLMPELHTWKVRWSILPFLRPSLERARRLICVSQATADDVVFHFPQCADKVRVVLSGVDPEFRPGSPEAIEATRLEEGAPQGYILYIGTLEPRKNVSVLLDAWEALRAEDRDTLPLVLAGPYGWEGEGLRRRLAGLAPLGVRYLGRIERARLVRLLQAARVFVYPSLYEGFGLPAAEALACGVPVVTSNTSSLPEVVGGAGLLVDPADAGALARAVRSIVSEPGREAELRERALARAPLFRWERTARETEEVFAEALG